MTRKLFVLKDVTDFAPGAFENTVVDNGSIRLGIKGNNYLSSGTYTGSPFTPLPFFRLIPSWNADTPPGTWVEVQARIAAQGQWSRWFSFGRWSPFIDRSSPPPQQDEIARIDGEFISVIDRNIPADTAQLRIILTSEDPSATPLVGLLALSVDSPQAEDISPASRRVLSLPAYSSLVRDPAIDERVAGACALTMLMNRWGEDVLPEEVARSAYDSGAGRYANISFLCATGGMYGFDCYAGFSSINTLRKEVWNGNAVGVRVHYRTNLLSHSEPEPEEPPLSSSLPSPHEEASPNEARPPHWESYKSLPLLEDATVDSLGHFIVLCGFVKNEDEEYVVVHDPLAHNNNQVRRTISLKKFLEIYMGNCIILRKGKKRIGTAKPQRKVSQIQLVDGKIHLLCQGQALIPGSFTSQDFANTTLCYTLSEAVPYASAAQHKFYYPSLNIDGTLNIDLHAVQGHKLTLYLIGNRGITWVAEKKIPLLPEDSPKEPESQ